MNFLIVGDLHGNKPKIHFKDFNAIIAPGDFCSSDMRKYMFEALKLKIANKDSKVQWYDICGRKEAKRMILRSLKDGREILEQLNSYNVPVYLIPGNNDWAGDNDPWEFASKDHYTKLKKGLKNLIDVHHVSFSTKDYTFIGHGLISGPEYPQYEQDIKMLTKQQLKQRKNNYDKTFRLLSRLFEKAKKPIIFLSHNVPFNTKIDEITDKNSPRCGYHFGSVIAKELIKKYQPLVCIGGHMHEHFDKVKIGKTIAVNAGFGSDVNILMELDKNKIKKLNFFK